MGALCCKTDDDDTNSTSTTSLYAPPSNQSEPLLQEPSESLTHSTIEYDGETKQSEYKRDPHNEYKSMSIDAHAAYKIPAVAISIPSKKNGKVPEAIATAFGGSLSNANFPFSLPGATSPFSKPPSPMRRQRSTTHLSYFEPECIICLDIFTVNNPRVSCRCRCKFESQSNPMHLMCLLSWTEQQQAQICPVCRDPIHFEGED
jgi:hypothetical protein